MAGHQNYVENRPWGQFEILAEFPVTGGQGQDVTVKRITVRPESRLSYQSHRYRSEHWTIVQGRGSVILDGQERAVAAGDTVEIPVGAKHRIINPHHSLDLVFIEVSTGHFDEQDNTRYEDDYGRAA